MDNKLNDSLSDDIGHAHDNHRIWYDENKDIGYLRISNKPQTVTERRPAKNGSFVFDYSESGELIGIEFMIDELAEFLTVYIDLVN